MTDSTETQLIAAIRRLHDRGARPAWLDHIEDEAGWTAGGSALEAALGPAVFAGRLRRVKPADADPGYELAQTV